MSAFIAAGPDAARERFHDYLRAVNHLREHPVWYNALTTNCTSAIRIQHAAEKRARWDWRMLVNGKGDELLFERRVIETAGLIAFPARQSQPPLQLFLALRAPFSQPLFQNLHIGRRQEDEQNVWARRL